MKPTEVTVEETEVPELTDNKKFDDRHPTLIETLPAVVGPMEIMMQAVQRGAGAEQLAILKEMFEFQKEVDAVTAKKAYVKAMAAFKASGPKILKKKKAGFDHKSGGGRTEYSFAPLPDICETIDPLLAAQGLHYDWKQDQDEKNIIITCIMTHDLGHSEKTSLRAPRDDSGTKNFIQSMGSTNSYLERYTLLAVAGLATHDMDDDGNAAGKKIDKKDEFITPAEVKEITKRMKKAYPDDGAMFLEWLEVETVDTIPASELERAKDGLAIAEKAKAEAAKAERRE